MFTYIPISLVALFVRPQWNPIAHNKVDSLEDFNKEGVQTAREISGARVKSPEEIEFPEESVEQQEF